MDVTFNNSGPSAFVPIEKGGIKEGVFKPDERIRGEGDLPFAHRQIVKANEFLHRTPTPIPQDKVQELADIKKGIEAAHDALVSSSDESSSDKRKNYLEILNEIKDLADALIQKDTKKIIEHLIKRVSLDTCSKIWGDLDAMAKNGATSAGISEIDRVKEYIRTVFTPEQIDSFCEKILDKADALVPVKLKAGFPFEEVDKLINFLEVFQIIFSQTESSSEREGSPASMTASSSSERVGTPEEEITRYLRITGNLKQAEFVLNMAEKNGLYTRPKKPSPVISDRPIGDHHRERRMKPRVKRF